MKKINIKRIVKACLFAIALAAMVGGAFYLGYNQGEKNPQINIIRGVANLENGKTEAIDFSLFWDAWKTIKDKYVGAQSVDNQNLVYGAISGLIDSLGDENSVFFSPTDAKKFNQDIAGQFFGIGAQLDIKNDQLMIVAPLKNSPAEKAGLKAGDKIMKVNDKDTYGMIVEEAVKLIRGDQGTMVKLAILRDGLTEPKEFSIVRDIIQIPTTDSKMIGDIAYIHLYNFYEQSPFLFYQAAIEAAMKNPKGLILDLRDNPGGYLDAAVNLAGWFMESDSTVVTEEFGSGEKQVYTSYGNSLFRDLPVVVIINGGSASASEILAGALRDIKGIKLVGEKSFGKGTVQQLETLKDGSMVKITVAHWRMPGGGLIDKNGIDPDFEVKITDADITAGLDPQLDKAVEVLKKEINKMPSNIIPILNISI
ncbi:MAG: S41 family peptidase [Candidatus Paceibacterota bacterium]